MKSGLSSKNMFHILSTMKIFILLCFFSIQYGCGQVEHKNVGKPKIQFTQIEFDFGNITMGEKVSHRFSFKNIGKGDLKIENVISSCGCTVVNYDKNPIITDKESFIEVSFNSDGYRGLQMKQIEVYSNCDSSKTTLTLWASVKEAGN
jgi:hypothetical protein